MEQIAKQTLTTAEKNEGRTYELEQAHEKLTKEHKKELKLLKDNILNDLNIPWLEAQLKAKEIEIEDLRNHSMMTTLISKNIKEDNNESWDDNTRKLIEYITNELQLYSHNEMDFQLSRAHGGSADTEEE